MPNPYTIILAPNPSIMTGPGTNTIVLGGGSAGATVIDPADDNPEHLKAIIHAGEERGGLRRILITHGHPDHIGGAAWLEAHLGIAIYAFSRQGTPLADEELSDNATIPVGDDTLRAIHTPGHSFDHLCFFLEQQRMLFAGDVIAGVGTVVINDMFEYLETLKRLQRMEITEMMPAHGPAITNPQAKLAEYITHRLEREQQVLHALENFPAGATIPALVSHIYVDVDPRLHTVAALSVKAHLLKLEREGRVRGETGERWVLLYGIPS